MRFLRALLGRKDRLWMLGGVVEEEEEEVIEGPGGVGSPIGLLLALTQAS